MRLRTYFLLLLSFLFLFLNNCSNEQKATLFEKIPTNQSGIDFANTISTNDSINVQTDSFIYNGAGVAAGDINNDGLPDLFFSGNMVSSRLYLNKGDMQFEDITEPAGVATTRWATGVSMVDINNNGYLDIYVSVSGPEWTKAEQRANLLFINNGDTTFTEAASEYEIDDTSFTTHAVFFDYNRNGNPDLFLLGNSPGEFARGETGRGSFSRQEANPEGFDQLYRNNGDGTFTNVSDEAGMLKQLGYGLGVAVSDLNDDDWPDIYVSNDITPNDVLYINNKDGTFTDKAADYLRHTSFAGMGIDIADFTNNGWPDILQTDMMPEELNSRKRMSGSTTNSGFRDLRRRGFFPHYNINTLQMNHGTDADGNLIFSEIARLAGVAYTNWSWTALFADFDNSGFKDIFITNGYPKAVNDFDYLSDMNGASDEQQKEILENLHSYEVPNYIFKNEGDLTFSNKVEEWGLDQPGFSYGAVSVDLNNNGRLDLVVNNIDAKASVYENTTPDTDENRFLQINLKGDAPNSNELGTKLKLSAGNEKQYIYHTPYRGYMSSMDHKIHFGLGSADQVDTLQVTWPDGSSQILTNLETNQLLTVYQKDASQKEAIKSVNHYSGNKIFREEKPSETINYLHIENYYNDFSIQSLLPYSVSKMGPAIAVADVTGNGFDDVYIGGSADQPGKLYLQQDDGRFIEQNQHQPWENDKDQEDWDAVFFDANGNGLLDLYVASGSFQRSPVSNLLQDRLYINHGDGRFLKDTDALPEMLTSTSSVRVSDFTGDGQLDLFVGGRIEPRNYPHPVRSYLLQNNNGQFTDITQQAAPELSEATGMITDAVWIDFTGNGQDDLVTVGEWMPVQFYINNDGKLTESSSELNLPDLRGSWFSVAAGDFNNDGHMDIVAGNLGLNHSYTTSEDNKFGIYSINSNGRGSSHIILSQEINGSDTPFDGLARLGRQILDVETKFSSFESFSDASMNQIFDSSTLANSLHYQADTFASTLFENNGDGTFTASPLPNAAQFSPVLSILAEDMNTDGNLDILIAGNIYHTEPNVPRPDAGNGLLLTGNGNGQLHPIPPNKSGFLVPGDVRDLKVIRTPDGKKLLAANNADSLQVFTIYNSLENSGINE